jgi:hypothetical protein
MPTSSWEPVAKFFGAESLPDSPIFEYTARLMSATYAAIGVFFTILALRPLDYGVMVPFSGWTTLLLGVVCAIIGFTVGMPTWWFMGDAGFCFVFGVLILVFWRQAKKITAQQSAT